MLSDADALITGWGCPRIDGAALDSAPKLQLIAHAAGRHSALTVWGAHLYFWARLAYVPLYAAGIPAVRTGAFLVSMLGIVLILIALT